jgi:hypothetical protein
MRRTHRAALVGAALALLAGGAVGTAPAAGAGENVPWVVDTAVDELNGPSTNGFTLREAVQESNEESGPSTIQLAPGAHYLLVLGCGVPGEEDDNTEGDLDVLNEPLTIVGNDATIEQGCGGENGERVIESTQDLTATDLTVQGGAGGDGGGIQADGEDPDVSLLRSVVQGNIGQTGGGLYVEGDLVLEDSTIRDNSAGDAAGARVDGLATVTRSSITGNQATSTGGLYASGGGLVMTQSAVTGNESGGGGGGIRASGSPLAIGDSTISSNTTDDVGGGMLAESAVTLTRSTLDGNQAENNGSNVHQLDGMTLTATVLSNGQPATNCNTTGGGTVTSLGFNAEAGSNSCSLSQPSDLLTNVQLRPLFNNGGGLPSNYPLEGSPLVDGLPSANGACNGEDQRTVARPQGDACDIGAVEVAECGEIFADVAAGNSFCWEIGWMDAAEVTTGFPDGFRPSASVTRQAMAAFMYRLVGQPEFAPPPTATFPDVPTTSTFFKEIEWLNAFAITTGFPDGDFRPSGPVTRQAMSAFMYRLAGEPEFEDPSMPSFADVALTSTFFTEIEWMASEGITTGFPSTGGDGVGPSTDTYRPSADVTRQAMSAFMYRLAVLPLIAGLPD